MSFFYRFRFLPLFLGILFLVIGYYYSSIKAYIPYQDPTPEITAQYIKNMSMGDTFFKIGTIFIWVWIIAKVILRLFMRR